MTCDTHGGEDHRPAGFWWENLRKRYHFEDLGVDGRIILKWILNKLAGRAWTELIWLRIGTTDGSCEDANEPSRSIKCGEILN